MLEIRKLDAFYGEGHALWAIDLDLREGEIVCVVGPNGAGKSTLVLSIAGLHRATRGTITMDGVDVTKLPAHRVCDTGISIVPEGRRIFPRMTVADNLELGAYRRPARAARGEGFDRVYSLFPKLRERSRQLAGSLSGGEQQMLAIGRALLAQPRLLLLDEPSLGLAPVIVDEVFQVIETINAAGVTILLVEQNVERALAVSARGYLLIEGRVVVQGPAPDLARDPDVRRAVLGI